MSHHTRWLLVIFLAALILRAAPAALRCGQRHPFSFTPYLYGGFSAAERARRRGANHRMRLVKMAVPAAASVTGEPYGGIALEVLEIVAPTPELGPTTVTAGENPVGGSYVGQIYSGKILSAERIEALDGGGDTQR